MILAFLYTYLILTNTNSEGNFSSLSGVYLFFQNPALLLAGWVHYLCFDQLIGAWILKDSQEQHIKHLIVVPCLMLTLYFLHL
jgi:hypothetical protein